jgi:hypothetical protein
MGDIILCAEFEHEHLGSKLGSSFQLQIAPAGTISSWDVDVSPLMTTLCRFTKVAVQNFFTRRMTRLEN